MRPKPLRTSVGAICDVIPPAPMQRTWLREKAAWSNPEIFRCRSSAPGIAWPRRLIDVGEAVNAGRMIFDSFPVDFDFEVLVHSHEPDETVAAEDRHQCKVTASL